MKVQIEKRVSKKDTNNSYYVAYVDLGYRQHAISYELTTIAELANCTPMQLVERIEREKKITI